jgi:hypothetical protein
MTWQPSLEMDVDKLKLESLSNAQYLVLMAYAVRISFLFQSYSRSDRRDPSEYLMTLRMALCRRLTLKTPLIRRLVAADTSITLKIDTYFQMRE